MDVLKIIDDIATQHGIETARPATGSRKSKLQGAASSHKAPGPEAEEIIGRLIQWAGSKNQAATWYSSEAIPAFAGRTAEAMVKDGKAAAVHDYLDHIAAGGFA